MYKKVVDDDGILESLNDKRTLCILLLKGLLMTIDTIRTKVLSLNDLDLLEEMLTFMRRIYIVTACFVGDCCKKPVCSVHKRPSSFYPLIWQARQMEIFNILADIHSMLSNFKKKEIFQYL